MVQDKGKIQAGLFKPKWLTGLYRTKRTGRIRQYQLYKWDKTRSRGHILRNRTKRTDVIRQDQQDIRD
jgi:hypothetical protein